MASSWTFWHRPTWKFDETCGTCWLLEWEKSGSSWRPRYVGYLKRSSLWIPGAKADTTQRSAWRKASRTLFRHTDLPRGNGMMVPTTAMKTAELAFLTSTKNMRTIMRNCLQVQSRTIPLILLDTVRNRNSRGCPAFNPCCTLCSSTLCSQCSNRCNSLCNDQCSSQCSIPCNRCNSQRSILCNRCSSPCTTRLMPWATTLHTRSELP